MLRRALLAACAVVVVASGCGDDDEDPAPAPAPPPAAGRTAAVTDPAAGVRFSAPAAWARREGPPPLVATLQTRGARLSVWRFPRGARLPRTRRELARARRALVAELRRRDPDLSVQTARARAVGGRPAVEVAGSVAAADGRWVVRRTHVYAEGAEFVVDAWATPRRFAAAERVAFTPVLRTLRITPPRG